jgi:hypothetical protein
VKNIPNSKAMDLNVAQIGAMKLRSWLEMEHVLIVQSSPGVKVMVGSATMMNVPKIKSC